MAWGKAGSTTLTTTGDTITVSSLSANTYFQVLGYKQSSGNSDFNWRVGNGSADSGNNYARRQSSNGGGDTTNTGYSRMFADNGGASTPSFQVGYFANKSDKQKLNITHSVSQGTAGEGVAPTRRESVNKWTDTSNPIDVIQGVNVEGGDFASGSEVVVLGWDESDTHTDNFWEELASVELGSAGDTLDSGTITAKKYLWFQVYTEGANTETQFKFNSTTGQEYASRRSGDGGSDSEFPNEYQSKINATGGASHTACLMNGFIINNSANEKLVITHQVAVEQTGSGTAPRRSEGVTKWANTSDSITSIQIINKSTGNFGTNSILKVWGSN